MIDLHDAEIKIIFGVLLLKCYLCRDKGVRA